MFLVWFWNVRPLCWLILVEFISWGVIYYLYCLGRRIKINLLFYLNVVCLIPPFKSTINPWEDSNDRNGGKRNYYIVKRIFECEFLNNYRSNLLWLLCFPIGIWKILSRLIDLFMILVSFRRCSVRLSWVNSWIALGWWLHTNIIDLSWFRGLPWYEQLLSAITWYICNHCHRLSILCWLVETHLGFLVIESPIVQGAGCVAINQGWSRSCFLQKSRIWIIEVLEESQY
jgi:hypothetical protein